MIVSGVLRTRKDTVRNLWTTNAAYTTSKFCATMRRDYFFQNLRVILFDDRTKGINADQQTNYI